MPDGLRDSTRGLAVVVEQGLFSGGGFFLNVLMARWLEPSAYGAVSVAFSILFLMIGVHNALQLEPLSILGPSRHGSNLPGYLHQQLKVHAILTTAMSVPLILAGAALVWLIPGSPLGKALFGVGVFSPFILLLWTGRRLQYVRERPHSCIPACLLYLILAPGLLLLAQRGGLATPFVAFAIMGLASVAAAATLVTRRALGTLKPAPTPTLRPLTLLREQWHLGKWLLTATILFYFGTSAQMYLVAALLGLEQAAVLRAVELPILPMAQAITALSTFALPGLSAAYGRGELTSLRRRGLRVTLALAILALLYEVVLLAAAPQVERVLYGGKFEEYAGLIPLMGLIPVLSALGSGFFLILRAVQKPRHYLVNGVVTTAAGLGSTALLVPLLGLTGAPISLVLAYAASAGVAIVLYRAWIRPMFQPGPAAVSPA